MAHEMIGRRLATRGKAGPSLPQVVATGRTGSGPHCRWEPARLADALPAGAGAVLDRLVVGRTCRRLQNR
jgi:hypothetical protein